jgi:hypothetical protein
VDVRAVGGVARGDGVDGLLLQRLRVHVRAVRLRAVTRRG